MEFKHGGNIFYYSDKLNLNEKNILDFSVNLNPLSFPEIIKDNIIRDIDKIYFYPEIYAYSLIKKISEILNISTSNIIAGNGSTQLIYLIPLALQIKKAVLVQPTFSEYENGLKRVNAKVYNFMLKEDENFNLSVDSLIEFLKKTEFDALYLCNPSNPVGNILDYDKLCYIAKFLENNDKIFVLDEAFIDFTNEKGLLEKNFKKCIILRSLTKIYGIAGLRLGFCKSDKETIKRLKENMEPWSLNTLSIIAGRKLLEMKDFVEKTKKIIEKERNYIVKEFSLLKGIKVFNSCTNYLLCKILNSSNITELEEFLINKKILIRNCSNFKGLNNKFFRIGIKKREENKILIEHLKEFLGRGNNAGII